MDTADPRARVRRAPARARYDKDQIFSILDQALICHVGFCADDGQPYVIPTIHARVGEALYLHGAQANRTLKSLSGRPWCVEATVIEGLVLARSAFHHSMNYRSAVIFGDARVVEDPAEKLAAFRAMVERLEPGRWNACRQPSDAELRATRVVRLEIDAASAKVRTGPPIDDAADYALPHWAGVVPLCIERGEPIRDQAAAPPDR